MPATGAPPSAVPVASPYASDDDRISGSIDARDAHQLEARLVPIQRLQVHQQRARRVGHVGDVDAALGRRSGSTATQVSIVPNASSPLSARSRAPSTLSRIHAIFGPEK